jgi:hypothetical protein
MADRTPQCEIEKAMGSPETSGRYSPQNHRIRGGFFVSEVLILQIKLSIFIFNG